MMEAVTSNSSHITDTLCLIIPSSAVALTEQTVHLPKHYSDWRPEASALSRNAPGNLLQALAAGYAALIISIAVIASIIEHINTYQIAENEAALM